MIVANTNKINSIISNISMLIKLDPKSKVLADIELIPNNSGIPQQKRCVKLVKTRI